MIEEQLLYALEVLGFNQRESKIIAFLLKRGEASVKILEKETNINRPHLYEILEKLFERGIIYKKDTRPKVYGIVKDIKIFKDTLDRRLELMNKALNKIILHLDTVSGKLPKGTMIVRNPSFIKREYISLLQTAKYSIKTYINDLAILEPETRDLLLEAASRISLKLAISDKDFISKFANVPSFIRYVEVKFPLIIGLFDSETLIVAYTLNNKVEYGVISDEKNLIEEYEALFRHIWVDDYLRTFYKLKITTPKEY
ncbi:MAG: hypothetical protein J7L38_00960 [Thermoproteales archaeon]|nr:hypothetical protein [Thermoproteales archaeon]